jgi:mevalonate kinase
VTLTVSANLPIGAGLGSSAAFSSCVAAALLIAHTHVSKFDFPAHEVDLVDAWSFLAEKVLHGNPSGIDNAVAVRGGAVAFTRAVNGKQGGLAGIRGFDSIRLLLTNTRVPRDTKSLVAGVSAKKVAEPEVVDPILDDIQAISDEARALLDGSTPAARDVFLSRIAQLMHSNHAHLRTLGVSHPSLEAVVAATAAEPYGLTTKLTGAGGGGCAVTLVPDTFPAETLDKLLADLRALGAEPHITTLGGPGLGVFRPASAASADGHATTLRAAGSAGLADWSQRLDGKWEH